MKKTRDYYDDDSRDARSFLVKVCDYGVAILLLVGLFYSTFLDVQGRFKPSNAEIVAARQAKIASEHAKLEAPVTIVE
ncbi:hypothetical protein [Phyllobacterium pellucidum]|uniref:hypothetical protein n=1 Tax=Phyllobacterium pellucidum TaxID=2740464 RepID=UPI001D14CCAF|nr:hypothetical protein [Phyllobacterium sp. T1018]UGY10506.1 hypothetical protein LLE51_004800 [Phyllobacterium sp. T1018]